MDEIYRQLCFMNSEEARKCLYMLIEGQTNINGLEVEFFYTNEEGEIKSLTMPTKDFLKEAICYNHYIRFFKNQLHKQKQNLKGD